MLDVTKPLPRGVPILFLGMASPTWLELKYEDIPDHCYFCGGLGHTYNECIEYMRAFDAPPLPYENTRRSLQTTTVRFKRQLANAGNEQQEMLQRSKPLPQQDIVVVATTTKCTICVGQRVTPKWLTEHKSFLGFPKKIAQAQQNLEQARTSLDHSEVSILKIRRLQSHLDNLLAKEEMYWKQRSRVNWLHAGDKNTHFFHIFASTRRNTNHINHQLLDDGSKVVNIDDILSEIERPFHKKMLRKGQWE
uniref:CCHC-type domain-containing protein n=1 Tax=Cannabis sativa TaxID=3483 RepID=A0A803QPN1_CANSA